MVVPGEPDMSKSKIDGGRDVWTCVGLACLGGAASAATLMWQDALEVAADSSRVYLAYAFLKAAQGALAWSVGLPIFRDLADLWRSARPATRATLTRAMALMLAMVFAYESIFDKQHLDWGLGKHWCLRFTIGHVIVFVPSVFAILTMWVSAVAADAQSRSDVADSAAVSAYLDKRDVIQNCLWYIGLIDAAAVLTNGMLREAMLSALRTNEDKYPSILVAANGGFYTMCIVICYVPAYSLLRRAGKHLQSRLVEPSDDIEQWSERRKKVAAILDLDVQFEDSLKNTIAILAPLIMALASRALPFFKATHN